MLLARRNNFIDEFFNDPFFTDEFENRQSIMKTDVVDDGTNYVIEMELPGFKKEDVQARLKEGYLTIEAKTVTKKEDGDQKNYIRKERSSGSAKRSFFVGNRLREEDIKASFENGLLKLTFPKEAPKQIEENHFITIE